jgi:hypothetical protein
MQVRVWDTYVERKDGRVMHFDIIAPDAIVAPVIIYQYGKEYLEKKSEGEQVLSSEECRFCHIEEAAPEIRDAIARDGYYILEMQNCA